MVTQSRSQPGILKTALGGLAQGAAQSLGRQGAEAVGGLIGSSVNKLGKKAGLIGPDKPSIQFWVDQGFSPEQAMQIAQQPPQIQQQLLKQRAGAKRAEAIGSALGGITGQRQAGQAAPSVEGAGSAAAGPEEYDLDLVEAARNGATEQDIFNLLKAKQGQEKANVAKEKLNLAQEEGKLKHHAATKETLHRFNEEYKASNEGLHRIERMRELEKEGLTGPARTQGLNALRKIPYVGEAMADSLEGLFPLNPASQEFQKLSQEFLRDLKSVFGGRISNLEVENYMKMVPTLMNTRQGRNRIYRNLEYMYKAKRLPFKIAREIKKENGGKTPLDIDDLVTERYEKQAKQLAKKLDFTVPEE